MALLILLVAFIVVPLIELYVIIQVGQEIGALPTIGILIADSIIGTLLLRYQGRAAWRRFNLAWQERRAPAKEVVDGALIIVGGTLLLAPGFITDIFGICLLLPPTRAVVRGIVFSVFFKKFFIAGMAVKGATMYPGRRRSGGSDGVDVEGTAIDIDAPEIGNGRVPGHHAER
jgi:UPF0716 protein FxsA